MKSYLITGGAGFIGSNFIKYMLEKYNTRKDIKLVVLDKLSYAGNLDNLIDIMNEIKFIKGDIANRELIEYIFAEYNIDYLINFAAESHVDKSIKDPQLFIETNVLGTQNLLDISKEFWKVDGSDYRAGVKFLQISTDEVYGSLEGEGYFSEKTALAPNSPYAASKASADMLVRAYHQTYNLPINITRCSNNYGPYQFPEKLIPLFVTNAVDDKELPIYGEGKNIRDWLYVRDHCQAIDLVLQQGKNGEVYNIGANNERTNLEITKIILQLLDKSDSLITYVSDRLGHDYRYAIDASKIKNDLDWEVEYSFETGIKETVQWYLDNEDWWRRVQSGEYQRSYQSEKKL
ncbi:dTDP-glucose 4,6-dehydratase [Orenia marismortui]|uniref:dTDP-glucose 4,6-dehydratase n=1 Tax=Orenia marismortui TaxID=46469 RepID=A0A4R8H9Q4_9FIRM|nr:dTDP-glucose 4,6-dehydratase [Orenia marismortui]TDX52358.1 dTDP-glucose 4,6-dehydratase [Orenia marismortui]